MAHPQIAVFARLAKGGDAPRKVIYGQATKLSRTMHDIHYNESRDEFYVPNPFAQAVLVFRGGATGQEAPIRTIQGPKTMLRGSNTLEVDDVNGEIFVPQGGEILVFPVTANGDVAPLRVLRSPTKDGWRTGGGILVDPVHNVLAASGTVLGDAKGGWSSPHEPDRSEAVLIFDRLAKGEVQPLRVIRGPKTGLYFIRQMEVQPQGGWMILAQYTDTRYPEPEGTFIGVWSINDSGNVPPRWKIEGKPSNVIIKPKGVALDYKHKEVITVDMTLNAVLTFYFPEIF